MAQLTDTQTIALGTLARIQEKLKRDAEQIRDMLPYMTDGEALMEVAGLLTLADVSLGGVIARRNG